MGVDVYDEGAWPAGDWVFRILDRLGLRYATRFTPEGEPYAGLRLGPGPGELLDLTLLAANGTFRVTAHDALPAREPAALHAANRRLPLCRAYANGDGRVDVAVDVFTGMSEPTPAGLGQLLDHVAASVRLVAGRPGDVTLPSLGNHPRRSGGDVRYGDVPGLPPSYVVHSALDERGWIEVSGRHEPDLVLGGDPGSNATLDRMQAWTRAGAFLVTPEGALRERVLTPILGDDEADLLQWSIDQVTLMHQVAERHLRPAGPAGG